MAKKRTVLLIDADVLRYLLAYKNTKSIDWDDDGDAMEIVNEEAAMEGVDDYIAALVERFKADDYVLALSCPTANFRKGVVASYKQARHEKPKPTLWAVLDKHIRSEYPHKIALIPTLEGDDVLGLLLTEETDERRICVSIDKDMKTVPGLHHNPNKPEVRIFRQTEHDAHLFWMTQTITGDTTDNYSGCPKAGPKTAEKAFASIVERADELAPDEYLALLWEAVVSVYEKKGLTADDALAQARLARILRGSDYDYFKKEIKLWQPS